MMMVYNMIARPADPTIPSMPSMILALASTKGSNQSPCDSSACAAAGVNKAASGTSAAAGLAGFPVLRVFGPSILWATEAGGTKRHCISIEFRRQTAPAVAKNAHPRVLRCHLLRIRLPRAIGRKHSGPERSLRVWNKNCRIQWELRLRKLNLRQWPGPSEPAEKQNL